MTPQGRKLLYGVLLIALANPVLGQRSSNWRVYKMRDGLPETACVSITLSSQGKILAKHLTAPSVTELDGYNLNVFSSPPGSGRIYESPGGQLWTVAVNGLQEMKEGVWVSHNVPELRPPITSRLQESMHLYPVRQGVVLCLLPDELLEINFAASEGNQSTVLRKSQQTKVGRFLNMLAAKDGGIWISGSNGLAKVPPPIRNLKPETMWQEYAPPSDLPISNLEQPHEDSTGGLTFVAESGTNHQKTIVYFDGNHWTARNPMDKQVRHAWRGPDGTWWEASQTALFHSETEEPNLVETDEISAREYFDVVVEPGGSFWLATSDGLFRFGTLCWQTPAGNRNAGLVHCLTYDSQDRLWFVSGGQLRSVQKGRQESYSFSNNSVPDLAFAQSLYSLKNGSLLLEGGENVVEFFPAERRFTLMSQPQSGKHWKILGALKDGKVCVQNWSDAGSAPGLLQTFDGVTFQPLPCPAPDSALGTHFSAVFESQNGDLWIGAEHGTALYHDKHWKVINAADKTSPDSPLAFVEMQDSKICCATIDKIWQFDGRDWSEVRRGFDRINAIVRSQRDASLWVASNGGLHRFIQGAWIENGLEEGLPSVSARALAEDTRGRLACGTTHGVSIYDPDADRDPPQAQIDPLTENEQRLREGGTMTMNFKGQDKWKQTSRDRLLFSYRLDEQEWSSFQELKQAVYPELQAGKHSFQIRAMDRNGNFDPKPVQMDFAVVLPWYKETRLLLISSAGAVVALFFAGLAFNRHYQLRRSYGEVERQVGERTQELEMASRELLHSQKMNALGTLAAGIAHDFNNILSIIKGSAQIIEDNLDNPQKVRTRVDRIKTVVEQGSGIVKAMLGFSRESDQQPAICAPNSVVQDTIRLLGDRFLREVQVVFEKRDDLPVVKCQKDFLQQILINLIFNAAESMDSRKEIVLATRWSDSLPREMILAPAEASNYVFVSVRDTGCGIPPENISRIFEPFFTTKSFSDRRGTGLGLSMVYELAKKIEAGLAVESKLGAGSTFIVILPVASTAMEHPLETANVK